MDELTEKEIQKAVSQGQKNQRTAERMQNWCKNARIVRSGGVGLIEQRYGVPIGHVGIECDHAPIGAIQSWDLEETVIDFYVRNCERCDKRESGSGPNIEPLVKAYKKTKSAQLQKKAKQKELEDQKRAERKLELDKLRTPTSLGTNQVVDLIEAIEKDENDNTANKLVKLARLAPEAFSYAVVEFLKKQILEDNNTPLATPALNTLLALPIDSETKRKLAVKDASGYNVHESAAKHLEKIAKELSPEDVKSILCSLTLEACPVVGLIQPKHQPNAIPLLTLASHHGKTIKETLSEWLGSNEEHLVEIAARAIYIITSRHPTLVKPFLREVFGKLLRHKILLPDFSNETCGEGLSTLRRAAARLFRTFPDDANTILQLLLEGSDETARSEGARLYISVLHKERSDPEPILGKAQNIAFERMLWMAVDIPDKPLDDEAIRFFSYIHKELLPIVVTHLDAMIGAAATLSSKMKSIGKNGVIEIPETGYEEIERSQKHSLIYRFQGNLVEWAFAASTLQGIDGVKRILTIYTNLPEAEVEIRSSMVAYLSKLMGEPEYVNLVLPHLYTAMTSPEPLVRGNAAMAIGKVAYELRRDFPELLFEIYLVFFTDPNVHVHKSAVHALNIHGFPENLKQQLADCLINLALVYMGNKMDGRFVIECLEHYAHGCLTDTQLSGKEGDLVIWTIGQLDYPDACEAVNHLGNSLKGAQGLVKLCAKCLQSEWINRIDGEKKIFNLLDHIPRNRIREAANELIDTAKSFADNRPHFANPLVVLLAKADCWTEATSVCEHILSVIPDTRRDLSMHLHFESLRQVCAFESARPAEQISIDEAEADWSTLLKNVQNEETDRNARDSFSQYLPPKTDGDEVHPFHQSFSNRLLALKALKQGNTEEMQAAATKINNISAMFGNNHPSADLRAFSNVLDCLAFAQDWTDAVRNADVDANRFRDACRLRAAEALEERANDETTALDSVLADIAEINTPSALADLKRRTLQIPLPFGVWVDEYGIDISTKNTEPDVPKNIEIAFVKFEIDGQPAKEIETLSPNIIYDIKIDIRVSHWPDSADQLIVIPVSIEPSDTYELQTFVINRPTGDDGNAPYAFNKTGRLLLKVSTAISANPLEFKYRAVFEPSHSEQPLEILGHRTLRIESHDPSTHAFSGYAEIDCKLRELRNDLRILPGLPHKDLCLALEVCAGLGNLAGQALSDNLFPEGTKEKEFQTEVIKVLRNRPNIGEDLELHPQTGGGIADLSFHRIRIELKAVPDGKIGEAEIDKFASQTAQYIVSSGKRIGVLCVLDSRKKTVPPSPAASHLRIIKKQITHVDVPIIFLCVKGGLVQPSDLSR